jgi:uncharacterized membrane protein YqgA involved in biofilm formation
VNSVAVLLGGLLGFFIKGGIPERSRQTVMNALGLTVVLIGLSMGLRTENVLVVLGSLVLGGFLGEWIDIEKRLHRAAARMQARFVSGDSSMAQAFVATSLIYCVGAMAITGSMESGLTGNHSTLYAKSMIDGISSVIFASTMGIGVAFSAISVFVYQGTLTLLAGQLSGLLTDVAVREMTATGGILIVAIGLNVLGLKETRVGNLIPAIFLALIFSMIL